MFGEKKSKNFFEAFSPQTSFFLGLIIGILVVCTVGFFVLLPNALIDSQADKEAKVNQNVNQPTGQPAEEGAVNLKKLTKDDHLRGSLDAPVIMVEFSDFQCSFCQRAHETLQKLVDDYRGQVAWVYKHFPIVSLHPIAVKVSEASECAAEQGKFWEYANELYKNQSLINENYLSELADQLNLNVSKFDKCLTSGKYNQRVNDNQEEGLAAGINGTPGIYVNDQLIKGALPYESFKQVIDSILTK